MKRKQYSSHEEHQLAFAAALAIIAIIGLTTGVSIYMAAKIQQKKRVEEFNSRRDAAAAQAATNNPNRLDSGFLLNAGTVNAQTNSN